MVRILSALPSRRKPQLAGHRFSVFHLDFIHHPMRYPSNLALHLQKVERSRSTPPYPTA